MIEILLTAVLSLTYHPTVKSDLDRLKEIASDVRNVVEDEGTLFEGPKAEEATELALWAVMYNESGLRRDVELCKGSHSRGDHGSSVGLPQLFKGPNWEGHSAEAICSDRNLQITLALHVLQKAKRCGSVSGMFGGYNAGDCIITGTSRRTRGTFDLLTKRAGLHLEGWRAE